MQWRRLPGRCVRQHPGASYRDFALFVSDNASNDETPEILARYAARDPRVKILRSPELIPQQANMNRAMALANTPWVKLAFVDVGGDAWSA